MNISLLVPINGQNYIIPEPNEVGWGSNLDDFFVAISNGVLQKTGGSFTLSAETDFGASFGLKSLYYKSRTANPASVGQIRLASGDVINFRNAANGADISLAKDGSDNLQWNAKKVLLSGDVVNADINASAAIAYSKLALTGSIVNADVSASAAIARSKLATGTAYTLVVNSSTGALSEVASVGSSGQVMTSNGPGVLPTFQNVAGTGTVNSGTANQLAYYASSTNAVSGLTAITASRALASDTNGLPVASTTTAAELLFVNGVTSAIQTQLNAKATDSLVVHLAGTENITGAKTFLSSGADASTAVQTGSSGNAAYYKLTNTATSHEVGIETATDAGGGRYPGPASSLNLYVGGAFAITMSTNATKALEIDSSQNTTLNGKLIFSNTATQGIKGTVTNDSAAAGLVGEVVSSTANGVVIPTTTQYGDCASISLTAGDWLVSGDLGLTGSSLQVTQMNIGISSTSGNSSVGLTTGDNSQSATLASGTSTSLSVTNYHVQLNSTTTYYLKMRAVYGGGTQNFNGRITAVRIR